MLTDSVDLYWLPLGAGDHVVRRCGRAYEAVAAAREHRDRYALYHAALEVRLDGARHVIESAPVWDRPEPDRGVTVVGPVGMPWLGRWKWFRYEVRRWRDGLIPDVAFAVDGPRRLSNDPARSQLVLDSAARFPPFTWGRDEQRLGEMWNSNSLIAWLLTVSGHDVDAITPPSGGHAPGWGAGIRAARGTAPVDPGAAPLRPITEWTTHALGELRTPAAPDRPS